MSIVAPVAEKPDTDSNKASTRLSALKYEGQRSKNSCKQPAQGNGGEGLFVAHVSFFTQARQEDAAEIESKDVSAKATIPSVS